MFAILDATLGAGCIAFPYAIGMNGIAFGTILIILGGLVSIYTSRLLVMCSDYTGKFRYEDYALVMYGKKMAIFTCWVNILCLMGFLIAYITFVSFPYNCSRLKGQYHKFWSYLLMIFLNQ